jgi:predicted GNAT superfamily acetyltransferase
MPPTAMSTTYRDLTTLDDFSEVVELERQVWGPGYHDVVPVPILAVSVKRGGILIGAFENDRLIGFVYSLPAIKHGKPIQWSHMLGVVGDRRRAGVGYELKMLQRDRTIAMGLDLIEWTFDPMQAVNAHFTIARLGATCNEYEENVYGASSSPLHKGNPTDRLVAEWRVREGRVQRQAGDGASIPPDARPAGRMRACGKWFEPADLDLSLVAGRISVEIPTGFTEMLSRAPELALTWRLATRDIFATYLARGYQVAGFFLDSQAARGSYLLAGPL